MNLTALSAWSTFAQACAAWLGVIGLAYYVIDTRKLRKAADAQLEHLRDETRRQRATQVAAAEPMFRIAMTRIDGGVRHSVHLVNRGAVVFDLCFRAEVEGPPIRPGSTVGEGGTVTYQPATEFEFAEWPAGASQALTLPPRPLVLAASYTTRLGERRWQRLQLSYPRSELQQLAAGDGVPPAVPVATSQPGEGA